MGCGASVDLAEDYPEEWMTSFAALQFRREDLKKMEKIFMKIDYSKDGKLDVHELLEYLDIKNNNFAKRIFSIFDENGDGTVDFREFVLSLWNFCSVVDASLRLFAFDLYDTDASGRIDAKEIENMLRDVYGPGFDSSQHAPRLLDKIKHMCSSQTKTIDSDSFAAFSREHPALLFPAFELQRKIQRKIMGVEFWDKHLQKRLELTHGSGNYLSLKQILESRVNQKAFKELVEDPLAQHTKIARERGGHTDVNEEARSAVDSAGLRYHRRGSGHLDLSSDGQTHARHAEGTVSSRRNSLNKHPADPSAVNRIRRAESMNRGARVQSRTSSRNTSGDASESRIQRRESITRRN